MKNGLIIISSVSREFLILNDKSKERKEETRLPCQNSFSTLSVRVGCAGVSWVGLFNRSVVLLLLTIVSVQLSLKAPNERMLALNSSMRYYGGS